MTREQLKTNAISEQIVPEILKGCCQKIIFRFKILLEHLHETSFTMSILVVDLVQPDMLLNLAKSFRIDQEKRIKIFTQPLKN